MILCPYCDAENIEGADVCAECELPLTDLSLKAPASDVERGLLRDRIESLKPCTPISVGPDETIGSALKTMMSRGVGCLPIVEGGRLLGIFSERDAMMRHAPAALRPGAGCPTAPARRQQARAA